MFLHTHLLLQYHTVYCCARHKHVGVANIKGNMIKTIVVTATSYIDCSTIYNSTCGAVGSGTGQILCSTGGLSTTQQTFPIKNISQDLTKTFQDLASWQEICSKSMPPCQLFELARIFLCKIGKILYCLISCQILARS